MIAALPPCGPVAAKVAILAAAVPAAVKDDVRQEGAGVDWALCGKQLMAVTIFSGGTAGDVAWVAFRKTASGWMLAGYNADAYKVGLFLVGDDLVESQPIYETNDPNCCPSGGFAHRRLRLSGTRLRVVRQWVDHTYRPAGASR